MKCNKCQRPMHKVDRRDELVQLDEDVTDGQMADYLAAEYSGDHGAWNLGIVEYFCHKCNLYTQVVNDELPTTTLLFRHGMKMLRKAIRFPGLFFSIWPSSRILKTIFFLMRRVTV